jgi:subtilisin family serine protease
MERFQRKGTASFWVSFLFLFSASAALGAESSQPLKLLVRAKGGLSSVYKTMEKGSSEERYLPLTRTHVLEARDEEDLESLTKRLQSDPSIESVERDAPIHAHMTPNDELFDYQWALMTDRANIGAEEAWNYTSSAQNILVAVVDSGCDDTHEDVRENLWQNDKEIPGNGIDDDGNGYVDDIIGYDFYNRDSVPADDFGHGTMVFGIIGATGNNQIGVTGLAWNARIMCLKVLDANGNSTVSTAVEGIEYAIRQGAKIINMSWGYAPGGTPSQVLETAIQKAKDAGLLVITSAGNGTTDAVGVNNDQDSTNANYPSTYTEDNIIAVAATDSSDQMAVFSNYGANSVDLGAPGVAIYSTAPGNSYEYFTGTSASAPYVTGSAALVWAMNPSLDYSQVKRLLLETTDPDSSLEGKTLTGGRLNVAKAILASPSAGGHLLESPPVVFTPSLAAPPPPSQGSGGCAMQTSPFGAPWKSIQGGLILMGILFLSRISHVLRKHFRQVG